MKRILFVDDEDRVLEGLSRMLHRNTAEWEMDFANSGAAALEKMAEKSFDVVVSDLRMPDMDGAELLERVSVLYPQVARIAFSGHIEESLAFRSVGATHQYLMKPCDSEVLTRTISRVFALRERLNNDRLRAVVTQIHSLPSLPTLYFEVLEELRKPASSLQRVGEVIGRDVAMSAKILKLVNSAYFGLPAHISSPTHAVVMLGLDTVRPLILTAHFSVLYDRRRLSDFPIEYLWDHSAFVSAAAREICRIERVEQKISDWSFMAGLLHDVGKLVLGSEMPHEYREALKLATQERIPMHEAEAEIIGCSHAEVGAYLLGVWGLPDPIVEAVAYHHVPRECLSSGFDPVAAVHVANEIALEVEGYTGRVDDEYIDGLGLFEHLDAWRSRVTEMRAQRRAIS